MIEAKDELLLDETQELIREEIERIKACPRCGELMLDTDDGPPFCETCMSDIADPDFWD
jgi:formylmethanofuran dehydrogenase subunit E